MKAKAGDKNPLAAKEQARKYAKFQNCRFVILSNGNLHYFWDLERGNPLDTKIVEVLRIAAEIQKHSTPVIEHCFQNFLLQSCDAESREYSDAADQIRELLIHENYLSQRDIEICLEFDVETLSNGPEIDGMRELHLALAETYAVADLRLAEFRLRREGTLKQGVFRMLAQRTHFLFQCTLCEFFRSYFCRRSLLAHPHGLSKLIVPHYPHQSTGRGLHQYQSAPPTL